MLALAAAGVAAQTQQTPTQQPPVFRGGTTLVRQAVGGDFSLTVAGTSVTTSAGAPVPFTRSGSTVTFTYAAGVDAYTVR